MRGDCDQQDDAAGHGVVVDPKPTAGAKGLKYDYLRPFMLITAPRTQIQTSYGGGKILFRAAGINGYEDNGNAGYPVD
jgi:hypothetical protein